MSSTHANFRRAARVAAPRSASVLLLVLVVVAILALGANTYLQLMQSEHRAVRRHGRAQQSLRLAESGVQYLKAFLVKSQSDVTAAGGLVDNSGTFQAQLADDQPLDVDRGRFTILCPAQTVGIYNGTRYGLENESAKLNLHALLAEGADAEARNRLLALPSMTPETADAILDWLDPDDTPREYGAEVQYYSGLSPSYAPRNGPIAGLDELLLVRGVTPELLYGLDQNHNFFVDADETPRGAMVDVDNAEGLMNRGWAAYLTITSVELPAGSPTTPRTDLNGGDLKTLYDGLKTSLTDEQAKFIILYRQYGQPPASNSGQPGAGSEGQGPSGVEIGGGQGTPNSRRAPNRGGEGDAGSGGGDDEANVVAAATIELNFQQQGGTQLTSLLDLVGAQLQVPSTPPGGEAGASGGGSSGGESGGDGDNGGGNEGGGDNNGGGDSNSGQPGGQGGGEQQPPPKTVKSPWPDNQAGYRDLLKLCDLATPGNPGRIAGRVNIAAASRPVLLSIPGMTPATVEQILGRREPDPNPAVSDQRHALWLLVEGLVQLEQMRQLERYITSGGDAFSGQSVGYFDADSMPVRGEFVVDRSVGAPRLRHWRDLSTSGPGFAPDLLGAPTEEPR